MNDDLSSLIHFKGVARLFPLPNVVLFPFVVQGLHIFEPRYRQMTADALAGDHLISMVLLKPGGEQDEEGRPALHSVACLGKIITDERLEDGRYNLQLRGLSRVRIVQEVETGKLYRSARVDLLSDAPVAAFKTEERLRKQLTEAVPAWCRAQGPALDLVGKLLKSQMPLGIVSDIISFALPLSTPFKQELLEITEVEKARRDLDSFPDHEPASGRPWPGTGFSSWV